MSISERVNESVNSNNKKTRTVVLIGVSPTIYTSLI